MTGITTSVALLSVGNALRRLRETRQLSQEAFADSIGMHRTYYSAVERGEKNITIKTLSKICRGLNISIRQLYVEHFI